MASSFHPEFAKKGLYPTPSEPETDFGATLRHYRESCGISQSELGRRAGIDHSTIGRLEQGKRNASPEMIGRLAKAMELDQGDRLRLMNARGFLSDEQRNHYRDPLLREIDALMAAWTIRNHPKLGQIRASLETIRDAMEFT